jgi:hypothetical protein
MDSDFQSLIDGTLSTQAQVATFIEIARQIEQETQANDESILGRTVHVSAFVDHTGSMTQSLGDSAFTDTGGKGSFDSSQYQSGEMVSGDKAAVDAALSQIVSLSDSIVFTFELTHDVIAFIMAELAKHSPFKSGRYMHSHVVFADGVLVEDTRNIPDFASEYLFVNTLPYAEKIETGESSMAPNGVYEIVANEATQKYGSTSKISFIDYAGTYGAMAQATSASHGKRTKRHFNRSKNRFPAIQLTFPNK